MKVVILAGGKGTRIFEESRFKPKPLIKIGNKPIIWHIIKIYKYYGFNDFLICGGYKYSSLKKFFQKSKDLKNIKVINTGLNSSTGGRLLRLKKYLKDEQNFFFTYGDGLSDINLNKLLKFHKKNNKICTLTAVKPTSQFGLLKLDKKNYVKSFIEKPKMDYINGGVFVITSKIFKYIKNDNTNFEKDVLTKLAKIKQLSAYKNNKFWKCMDSIKDKNDFNKLFKNNKAPWKKW